MIHMYVVLIAVWSTRKELWSSGFCSHLCQFFTICKQAIYLMRSNFVCDSCQKAVLNELDLGPNIARNTALSENVFMMVVCIELRIPLFVVGKPGSSKSLAKTVVADNMQGDAARSQLFKTFKQVIWPFQIHYNVIFFFPLGKSN